MWYVWAVVAVGAVAVIAVAASRTVVAMRRREPSPGEIERGKGTQPDDNYDQRLRSDLDAYKNGRLDAPARRENFDPDNC